MAKKHNAVLLALNLGVVVDVDYNKVVGLLIQNRRALLTMSTESTF